MIETLASSQDLIDRSLRPLTDTELTWGSIRLDDALDQIVTLRPSVAARLDDDPVGTFSRIVRQIQCAMVLRVLNNPDGTLEETGDDYTRRLDASVSTGALYITEAELALLSSFDGVSDGAFTIGNQTMPSTWYLPDPWGRIGQVPYL